MSDLDIIIRKTSVRTGIAEETVKQYIMWQFKKFNSILDSTSYTSINILNFGKLFLYPIKLKKKLERQSVVLQNQLTTTSIVQEKYKKFSANVLQKKYNKYLELLEIYNKFYIYEDKTDFRGLGESSLRQIQSLIRGDETISDS